MTHRMPVSVPRLLQTFGLAAAIVFMTASPIAGQTPTTTPAAPSITATPQDTVGEGKIKTTITWSTGDGSNGEVYVSIKGAPELLFGGLAPSGTGEADWIDPGTYVFRLYAGTNRERVLAEVTVTRTLPPMAAGTSVPQSGASGLNPVSVGIGVLLLVFIVWVLVRAARNPVR